jgi:hypothetical protein
VLMCAPVELGGFFKEIQFNQNPITCKFWQVLSIYRQNDAHECVCVYYTDSPTQTEIWCWISPDVNRALRSFSDRTLPLAK